MKQDSTLLPDKDPGLWEIARERASFKDHLGTYIVINVFFWLLWYFSADPITNNDLPWPVWSMLGWGIGLVFHWLEAYVYPESNAVEREYEKLKQQSK